MSHKNWHQPTRLNDTPRQTLLSCKRKFRHPTLECANTERDRLASSQHYPGYHYETYYCAFCNGYHIGKVPDSRQFT